ncbi:hypothetical protein [Kineococcus sp. NPDC059986]|uniref:hypothetical protein n=1 Tax=Kineococcus sp. NPDC059986 TaxID=3155538 RepID=UPI00345031D2
MGGTQRVLGTVAAVLLGGCGSAGDVSFENNGTTAVRVVWDDDEGTVEPSGGLVVLGSGCLEGDVDVVYPDGRAVTVDGPVCPDRVVEIGDAGVELRDQNGGGSSGTGSRT